MPALSNFQRMMSLIDEVFSTRNDPGQLQVDAKVMQKLEDIHSATLSELADDNGPVIWVLIIPTTKMVMRDFLEEKISEKEILQNTIPGESYDCIYLCSVTTLPEYRGKGSTKKLCMEAIQSVCNDHTIKTLFVWPFTKEGEILAKSLAMECKLELKILHHS
jgi:Acetyltransferase (GNAT) domain